MGSLNSSLKSLESVAVDVNGESKSFKSVVADLTILEMDEWVPRGVIRCQEQCGAADPLNVHGYIIVRCTEGDCQDQEKFLRLDFGAAGILLQKGKTDGDFKSAAGIEYKWTASTLSTLGWGVGMAAVGVYVPMTAGVMLVSKGAMLICKGSGKLVGYQACKAVATLGDICDFVKENKNKPYNLSTWNCNNFADELHAKLLT